MQIKIEIDVKPEELRRFLGLPDIAGLQEEIITFLREKVGVATEFDAAGFLKANLETLRKSNAWKNIVSKVVLKDSSSESPATPTTRTRRKSTRTRKSAK